MTEMRYDSSRGEWIAFASHRQSRTFLPAEDHCPLCPTRDPERPTEVSREAYDIVVFDNKFPAFTGDPPIPARLGTTQGPASAGRDPAAAAPSRVGLEAEYESGGEFMVRPSAGACEVVVYSDDHHLPMAEMSLRRIRGVVEVWADRYSVLGSRKEIDYVFVFENKGVEVGVTLHHPHGQIYGYPLIPPVPARELEVTGERLKAGKPCNFCAQAAAEDADGARMVARNADFVAFVPFAARFPYEVHILSTRHFPSIAALPGSERTSLAAILRKVIRSYNGVFDFEMPYIMAMHQAPTGPGSWDDMSHFHIEFYPPYRTRDKLKYLAGSELGAGAFLNDAFPEETAAQLRTAVERDDSRSG